MTKQGDVRFPPIAGITSHVQNTMTDEDEQRWEGKTESRGEAGSREAGVIDGDEHFGPIGCLGFGLSELREPTLKQWLIGIPAFAALLFGLYWLFQQLGW